MRKKTELIQKQYQDLVIVRKSNDLIEARYKMTMWEARVWDKFLSILRKEREIRDEYKIPISEIIENYQLQDDKRAFQRIVQASHALQDRYITSSSITREEFRHLRSHIFASVETVVTHDGDSYILFEVPNKIKPILTATNERYKDFALENFIGISSFYSKRIYELLKQYERIGERTFSMSDLRNVLAIEETEYKLYGHFKKRIIDKAQEDLLRCTDISFTYEEVKKRGSKQVTAIRFVIKANKALRLLQNTGKTGKAKTLKIRDVAQLPLFQSDNQMDLTNFEELESQPTEGGQNSDFAAQNFQIVEDATQNSKTPVPKSAATEGGQMPPLFEKYFAIVHDWWGVEQAEFVKRLTGKDEDAVLKAVEYTKSRVKAGKASNPAGVFLDALTKGYKTNEQLQAARQATDRAEKQRLAQERQEKKRELLAACETLETNYSEHLNDTIRNITTANPEVTQIAIDKIKTLYRQLGMTDMVNKTIEDFRQNTMLRNMVKSEIMAQFPAVFVPMRTDYEQKRQQYHNEILAIDPNYRFQ
jgi:plasmid replication initiation protein